jgi:hypothetical protein
MTESIEFTRQAAALLRHVSRPAVDERSMVALSDEDLCVLLRDIERVGRLTDALRALATAEVDDRSRHELGTAGLGRRLGYTKPSLLIERATLVSQREASRRIRLGQAISPRTSFNGEALPPRYPLVASAMADGAIGVDAASITVRCLDQAGGRAEPTLLHEDDGRRRGRCHPERSPHPRTAPVRHPDRHDHGGSSHHRDARRSPLDDVAEPVSSATIRQLVCDAGLRKIVLGDDG